MKEHTTAVVTEQHPRKTGRDRKWALNALLILIPVLFFVGLEGALRLFGYGDSYPLFIPVEGRPDYLYQNREVARRYFTLRSVPNAANDFFKAEKEPGSFRIFVQGESSAAGFPTYYGGTFSRMLEQRLAQTFPGRRIEVVNTAMAAVNSYTLLDLADEIIAQKPDAVLIYTGHNEYYGALGVGSAQSVGGVTWITRAYIRLMKLRTGQMLRDFMVWVAGLGRRGNAEGPPSATLMERMVGRQSIALGSPVYEMGLRQFRSNMDDLLEKYRRHGIPVFLATVASNERDLKPFISGHAEGTDAKGWQEAYRQAEQAVANHPVLALEAVDDLVRRDSLSAAAYFLKGRLLERLGRSEEARQAYLDASDRDELRFRAPEAINRIIREEAARPGVTLVDVKSNFENASPQGVIGSNLMLEHLHPNIQGHFLMADAFYEALHAKGMIGAWTQYVPEAEARAEVLITPADSLAGAFRLRKLMGSWPFQPPGIVDRTVDEMQPRTPLEKIALDLYHERVPWIVANDAQRRYFEETGDLHNALRVALASVQEYPFSAAAYINAGNELVRQRRYSEALEYFGAANDLEESSPAYTMIGSILLQRGNREQAVRSLVRAVQLDPENEQALYNLGGAYALGKEYDKARTTAQRLLSVNPAHVDAQRLLASLPPSPDSR